MSKDNSDQEDLEIQKLRIEIKNESRKYKWNMIIYSHFMPLIVQILSVLAGVYIVLNSEYYNGVELKSNYLRDKAEWDQRLIESQKKYAENKLNELDDKYEKVHNDYNFLKRRNEDLTMRNNDMEQSIKAITNYASEYYTLSKEKHDWVATNALIKLMSGNKEIQDLLLDSIHRDLSIVLDPATRFYLQYIMLKVKSREGQMFSFLTEVFRSIDDLYYDAKFANEMSTLLFYSKWKFEEKVFIRDYALFILSKHVNDTILASNSDGVLIDAVLMGVHIRKDDGSIYKMYLNKPDGFITILYYLHELLKKEYTPEISNKLRKGIARICPPYFCALHLDVVRRNKGQAIENLNRRDLLLLSRGELEGTTYDDKPLQGVIDLILFENMKDISKYDIKKINFSNLLEIYLKSYDFEKISPLIDKWTTKDLHYFRLHPRELIYCINGDYL